MHGFRWGLGKLDQIGSVLNVKLLLCIARRFVTDPP